MISRERIEKYHRESIICLVFSIYLFNIHIVAFLYLLFCNLFL